MPVDRPTCRNLSISDGSRLGNRRDQEAFPYLTFRPQRMSKEAPRSFLLLARRNLTDDELSTPAVRRFLIAEVERLDQQCAETQGIVTEYHEQRITIAKLQESAKPTRWVEILSSVCLAVGAAGLGAATNYLTIKNGTPVGIVISCLSTIMLFFGIAPKVWK